MKYANGLFIEQGQTGFPWIDAIMTQLREEGWIHHLARHAVACFLTRGDLWISWEEGMKVEVVAYFRNVGGGSNARISFSNVAQFLLQGVRRAAAGRRLVDKRRDVDVAIVQFLFPTILSLLLPSEIRKKGRPER